jgi:hypothetical protein
MKNFVFQSARLEVADAARSLAGLTPSARLRSRLVSIAKLRRCWPRLVQLTEPA